MVGDWTTIGDIAQVFDGPHATPKKIEEGSYFLSISSLENGKLDLSKSARISEEQFKKWTKRVTPRDGDVLFSYETRLGEAALMPGGITACLGRRMGLLRPDTNKVAPRFLLFAYLGPAFQQEIRTRTNYGATVERIALKELPDFPIQIPSLSEQKAIAHILGTLDDKIELNRQMNATLEAMAQALFKSWFVDFDPVIDNALAAGHPIPESLQKRAEARVALGDQRKTLPTHRDVLVSREAGCRERPEAIQKQFPSHFVFNEEMGWVPEGWEVKSLCKLGRVSTGKTPPKKLEDAFGRDGIPFITPTDVDESIFITSTNRYLSERGASSIEKSLIGAGAICITCIGSQMGKTIISPTDAATNQQINSIQVNQSALRNMLFLSLRNRRDELYLLGSSGSTMPIVNKSAFESLTALEPADSVLMSFDSIVAPFFKKILSNAIENKTLNGLRDTLLPKLLSGQLRIPDAEKLIEEASA